jgi:DNA repair exonuclease SbcCD ATPase subunit
LMADRRTLAFLRELERADEEVAAALAELDDLARQVDGVRARVEQLETFLARLPAERSRLQAAEHDWELHVRSAGEELAAAERELNEAQRARDESRATAAHHRVVRARDALMAERRLAEGRAERRELESEAQAVEQEISKLEDTAGRLAVTLAQRPRLAEQAGAQPVPGLTGVGEWASGARAALVVARSSLASERDALIRQANELGALVLGEPVLASSPGAIARRLGHTD